MATVADFRLRFPEFGTVSNGGVPDAQLMAFLAAAARELSNTTWGGYTVVPAAWQSGTAYLIQAIVTAPTYNGLLYQCTTGGTSGGSAPTFPVVVGQTVSDNGVVWTCMGPVDLSKVDWGQMYLAAHKLAISPFGQNAKLVLRPQQPFEKNQHPWSRTTYGNEFWLLLRSVTSGFRAA